MKKIKIHYTISQKMCGEIKRVFVVGNSELQCYTMLLVMFPAPHFAFDELWREVVDGNERSEVMPENCYAQSDNKTQNQNS